MRITPSESQITGRWDVLSRLDSIFGNEIKRNEIVFTRRNIFDICGLCDMHFHIRPIQKKDFEGFREIFSKSECLRNIGRESKQEYLVNIGEAYVNYVIQDGDLRSFEALCSVFRSPPGRSELWVLIEVTQGIEKVLGGVALEFKGNQVAELRRLCVSHEVRRRGLGLQLTQRCLSFAQQRGYRRVFLTTPVVNTGAIVMYMKAGFVRDVEDQEFSSPELGINNLKIAQLVWTP